MSRAMTRKPRVFIDGQAGTIGLRLRELLKGRTDLELLEIDPSRRKDARARAALLDEADVSILCLPDDAAREAVGLITNPEARVIDGSTAHRVAPGWVYGVPELQPGQREAIARARRVGNPGCYPSAVALLMRPLIEAKLIAADAPLTIHALSGYSGGGNAMIDRWQSPDTGLLKLVYEAPYALDRRHKHIPEMTRYGALAREPLFVPAVGPFRCGMRVQIPIHVDLLEAGASPAALHATLAERYAGERFVRVIAPQRGVELDERALDPQACNDTNRIELRALPHPAGHTLLVAVLDNLMKGAAGPAVQSLNLMLGLPEATGLPA
jgi:N-acetyl-gamma-glutamyl-phosphate reductase